MTTRPAPKGITMNCTFCGDAAHEGPCAPATPTARYPHETPEAARILLILDRKGR
jgi:hypothetical protein